MKNVLTLAIGAMFSLGSYSQITFWTEDFGSGCNTGQLATSVSGPNGAWSNTNTGTNAASSNIWYISAAENGEGEGNCGAGCGSNRTLHLGSPTVLGIPADPGAAYYEGLSGFCDLFPCGSTSKRIESPVIDCSSYSSIEVDFLYLEGGNAIDNATFWYFDGSTWSMILDTPKTPTGACSPQGQWTAINITLPASADNNPNVRIGFQWVNNDDGNATDPSFAVDDIMLSGMEASGGPIAVCQDITISLDAGGSAMITAAQVDGGSTDDVGIINMSLSQDSFDCSDIGENEVTLMVEDGDGNTDSCTAIVTIVDDTPPVAECNDFSIMLDQEGIATITPNNVSFASSDNCEIANISLSQSTFTTDDIGGNAIVVTLTDGSGNQSTCASIVTVNEFELTCPYDVNNDGVINSGDLVVVLGAFGTTNPIADFNLDGVVNTADLIDFLSVFGGPCE